jgi:hypothetical protein
MHFSELVLHYHGIKIFHIPNIQTKITNNIETQRVSFVVL